MPTARRSGHFHAVRFYESPEALSRIVADFLAEGLAQGLPAVIIATAVHRTMFEAQLQARGFDLQRLTASDDLIIVDADAHLATFMVDGMPDADRFRAATIPLIERASRRRQACVIRAYGEMVDVLWQAGQTVAATRLEMLWNELAATHDFALLCGYSMGHFYKHVGGDQLRHGPEEIYEQHTHVLSASGMAAPIR
jgi:hypothetical protein